MAKDKDFDSYKEEVVRYLTENFEVTEDEAVDAVEEHVDAVQDAFLVGSFAYYAGDQIAKAEEFEDSDDDDDDEYEDDWDEDDSDDFEDDDYGDDEEL